VLFTQATPAVDGGAVQHLRQAIMGGKHWYTALLETIRLWTVPEETVDGRTYRYLIAGEAFDWLLLAERLCLTVNCLLPEEERTALLFHGRSPLQMSKEEFKTLLGCGKYRQCLNYFYGVLVEEALFLAVQDEVRKEWRILGFPHESDHAAEVYKRIYGVANTVLLKEFRLEMGYPHLRSTSLSELKELHYWLFKYRLKHCDKAKVASDTQKALNWLKANSSCSWQKKQDFKLDEL
jgi:hypothetical protein